MLVLTRKAGESIRIGNQIVVTVLEKSSGGVRIGIEAPIEITIYREEIYRRIQQENRNSIITQQIRPDLFQQFINGKR